MKNETNTPRRGRPAVSHEAMRIPVTVKLPRWLVEWLRAQDEPQSRIIEKAIFKAHKMKRKIGNKSIDL